ncbi:MAG: ABC transporter substrate-binding protein [Thiotrichaceae bacterium]
MKRIVMLLSCLLLISCNQPPPAQLKIAIEQTWIGYLPMIIAQEQGLFAQQGVSIALIPYPAGKAASHAYEAGEIDGVLGIFADVLMMNVRGIPAQVVYVIDSSNTADMIVAKPEYHNLAELRGKTIAFDGINSFSHLFVIKALEKVGIHEGDFHAANLPIAEVLPALESGKIDAGYVYTPESNAAIAKGYHALVTAGEVPGIITDVFTLRPNVIAERPQEIAKIIKALVAARHWMLQHPQESLELLAKATGIAASELEVGFKGLTYPDLEQNIAELQPGGELFQSGAAIIDFYTQRGQIAKKPDLDTIINGTFVIAASK